MAKKNTNKPVASTLSEDAIAEILAKPNITKVREEVTGAAATLLDATVSFAQKVGAAQKALVEEGLSPSQALTLIQEWTAEFRSAAAIAKACRTHGCGRIRGLRSDKGVARLVRSQSASVSASLFDKVGTAKAKGDKAKSKGDGDSDKAASGEWTLDDLATSTESLAEFLVASGWSADDIDDLKDAVAALA